MITAAGKFSNIALIAGVNAMSYPIGEKFRAKSEIALTCLSIATISYNAWQFYKVLPESFQNKFEIETFNYNKADVKANKVFPGLLFVIIAAPLAVKLNKACLPKPLTHRACTLAWKNSHIQNLFQTIVIANALLLSTTTIFSKESSKEKLFNSAIITGYGFSIYKLTQWKTLVASIFIENTPARTFAKPVEGTLLEYTFSVFSGENYSYAKDGSRLALTQIIEDFAEKVRSFDKYPKQIFGNTGSNSVCRFHLPKEFLPQPLYQKLASLAIFTKIKGGRYIPCK